MSDKGVREDEGHDTHYIGLISDTHVPVRAERVPEAALEHFRAMEVELILHAGDLVSLSVLDELKVIAPVVAVHGNMCDAEVVRTLPAYTTVEINHIKIGLTHGSGGPIGYVDRMLYFAKEKGVDVMVSGHTHSPYVKRMEGKLLVNPGSVSGNTVRGLGRKRRSIGILAITGRDYSAEIYRF